MNNTTMNNTKIVLLDMDGVLVDFLAHWLNYLEIHQNLSIKPEQVVDWHLHSSDFMKEKQRLIGVSDKDWANKVYSPFEMPGFWRNAPLMPGALDFIKALKLRTEYNSFKFYICSAPSGALSAKEKVEYIQGVFGNNAPYILTKHKELIMADMLVDDHPENCYKWLKSNANGMAVCPNTPYCLNELCKLPNNAGALMDGRLILTEDLTAGTGFDSILKRIDERLELKTS